MLTRHHSFAKGTCVALYSEFFIADHHQAVARAKAREAGKSPAVDVPVLPTPGLGDLEIEVLGELAVKKRGQAENSSFRQRSLPEAASRQERVPRTPRVTTLPSATAGELRGPA